LALRRKFAIFFESEFPGHNLYAGGYDQRYFVVLMEIVQQGGKTLLIQIISFNFAAPLSAPFRT
jgi:hypothetical protein